MAFEPNPDSQNEPFERLMPGASGLGDKDRRLRILVIEDNPADVRLLEKMLADWPYDIESAGRLAPGLERLVNSDKAAIDLVLLDLSLPDSQGMNSFYELHLHAPHVPVIVLTGLEDECVGSEAVQLGAQDYLVKGQVLPGLLGRAIRYGIERHQTESKMKELNDSLEKRVVQLATANQELHKLGKALSLSCEHALQASRSKSEFVARISHDIRSPISAVLGITELLLKDQGSRDPAETRRLIRLIDDSVRSQLSLLTEILDFSKVEAGKVELSATDFCPVSLLEDTAELFAASAAKKGLSLMTYIDAGLQPLLHGDPTLLREILINLTNNALKFTALGDVVLRATRESEDSGYVTARFSVVDSGVGMSDSERKRLFEPFSQVQAHKKTAEKGEFGSSGLGLSICKGLVDLMGGQIGVESTEGKGSTFWFSVRLKRSLSPAAERDLLLARPVRADVRVLIVDRNSTERDILQRYVESAGWKDNGKAANADEAMEMLYHAEATGEPYDVAVIELEGDTPDSFELAHQIETDPILSATRLIFLTAVDQRIKGEQAWAEGFSAYLTRPIKQFNLLDCISEVAASSLTSSQARSNSSHSTGSHTSPILLHGVISQPDPDIKAGENVNAKEELAIERRAKSDAAIATVLVVEDNPIMRGLLVLQLEKVGIKADAAVNGLEAVEAVKARNKPYSLILMDCQMPVMSGLDASIAIRRLSAPAGQTPIVAVTAGAPGQGQSQCLAAGMNEYLMKPLATESLHQLLGRWSLLGVKTE